MHGHLHKHIKRGRRDLDVIGDISDITADSTLQAKAASLPDDTIAKQIEDGVATIVSVVYVTASATFTGATAGYVTLGLDSTTSTVDAAAATTTKKSTSQDDETTTTHTTAAAAKTTSISTSAQTTSKDTTSKVAAVKSTSSEKSSTSSKTSILTTSSSVVLSSTTIASSSTSHSSTHDKVLSSTAIADTTSTSSPSASASTTAAASTGLSSGAKGGIAFAVILLVGLVAGLIFFFVRRKKEQQKNKRGLQRLDDEKSAIRRSGTLTPQAAPSIHPHSASAAPRLTVRPNSQFSSNFLGDAEKAGGAAMSQSNSSLSADPSNPFGIHAQTVDGQSTDKLGPATTTLKPFIELPGSPVPSPLKSNPTSPSQERSDPLMSPNKPEVGTAAAVPVFSATGTQPGPAANNVHRVQLAFKPSMDDELELKPGELIRLLHEYDDGWALCVKMDRSKQGVAPRTCLSKLPLKPRPVGPPNGRPMGLPVRPMDAPAQGRRNFSGPAAVTSKAMVPAPLTPGSGRVSPTTGSPKIRQGPRQRARTVSNAAAGPQNHPRAMSPAPIPSQPMIVDNRPRRNSMDQAAAKSNTLSGPSPSNMAIPAVAPGSSPISRKPVPGQAL